MSCILSSSRSGQPRIYTDVSLVYLIGTAYRAGLGVRYASILLELDADRKLLTLSLRRLISNDPVISHRCKQKLPVIPTHSDPRLG
jgi:hypothetical protein